MTAAAVVRAPGFQRLVVAAIVVNAVVLGLETVPGVMAAAGAWLRAADRVLLAFFVVEIGVRLAAEWPRPHRFLRDGWNVFDAVVVAVSLLPQVGAFASVARLARILRVARLVSAVPELRLIVETMLRSMRSLGHVALLLGLLLYVYGVVGHHLFREADPARWGSLARATGTLFQILTLEGWVEVHARSQAAVPLAWLFYASFIVIAVFVLINLFIAVVVSNLEAVKRDLRDVAAGPEPSPSARRQPSSVLRAASEMATTAGCFSRRSTEIA